MLDGSSPPLHSLTGEWSERLHRVPMDGAATRFWSYIDEETHMPGGGSTGVLFRKENQHYFTDEKPEKAEKAAVTSPSSDGESVAQPRTESNLLNSHRFHRH